MLDMELQVDGLKELGDALTALPLELAKKALNDALVAGGHVIADKMAELAPRDSTHGGYFQGITRLEDSIVVQIEKHPIGSAAEVYVGPNARVQGKNGFIARFVEFGTALHNIIAKRKKLLASASGQVFGSKVSHPGGQARPFMRPARDQAAQDAVDAVAQSLRQSIQDAAAKVRKK